MTAKDKVLSLLDGLPEPLISQVVDFIEFLAEKRRREAALPAILAEAPVDDEPTTAEDLAAIAEALADPHPISLEEMKRRDIY